MEIIGHPWDSPELLHALRPVRRNIGTYGPVPGSQLGTLSVILPEDMAYTAEAADYLVGMLFGTVVVRAEMGRALERLIITECLSDRPSFQAAFVDTSIRGVSFALETCPCVCDEHDFTPFGE